MFMSSWGTSSFKININDILYCIYSVFSSQLSVTTLEGDRKPAALSARCVPARRRWVEGTDIFFFSRAFFLLISFKIRISISLFFKWWPGAASSLHCPLLPLGLPRFRYRHYTFLSLSYFFTFLIQILKIHTLKQKYHFELRIPDPTIPAFPGPEDFHCLSSFCSLPYFSISFLIIQYFLVFIILLFCFSPIPRGDDDSERLQRLRAVDGEHGEPGLGLTLTRDIGVIDRCTLLVLLISIFIDNLVLLNEIIDKLFEEEKRKSLYREKKKSHRYPSRFSYLSSRFI